MTATLPPQSDEIDLRELLLTLWQGKSTILLSIFAALVASGIYLLVIGASYRVSLDFSPNYHSVSNQQACENTLDKFCLINAISSDLVAYMPEGWSATANKANMRLNTKAPLDQAAYDASFLEANRSLSEQYKREAQIELQSIQSALNPATLGTERVATNALNAKRLLAAEGNGELAVSLSSPISISTKTTKLLVLLSVLLGGMLGASLVMFRSSLRSARS